MTHPGILGSLNPRAPVAPEPQAAVLLGPASGSFLTARLPAAPRAAPRSLTWATGPLLLPRGQARLLLSPVTPRTGGHSRPHSPVPGWTVPGAPRVCREGRQCRTVPSGSPGGRCCVASGGTGQGGAVWPGAARREQRTRMSPGCKRPASLTWAEPPSPGRPGRGEHSLLDGALPGRPPPRQQRVTSVVPADTCSLNDF